MGSPPESDAAFARWLAAGAGEELLRVRAEQGHADPRALKAAGDKTAHDLLRAQLARWRPDDAVLSEEDEGSRAQARRDGASRLSAERVWIVDPLDGTREFAEAGRDDWAVHVALWGRRDAAACGLTCAAVALPAQQRVLGTDAPPRPPAAGAGPIRIAASRSRPPALLTAVAAQTGAQTVPMGSAGAKIAAVISGEVDAYLHTGGQYEWDSAAPVAVALAAGLHASRVDGSALEYNRPDPYLPDLLVCRADLAGSLLAAVSANLREN